MLLKCHNEYSSKHEKLNSGQGLEKVSLHSNSKKGIARECSDYHTNALISHTSKEMLKILQARLQWYVNASTGDEALFQCTKPSGVPRGPSHLQFPWLLTSPLRPRTGMTNQSQGSRQRD